MALCSYNHLLKQVQSLKSENSHLRRELQDNSSHLTKLENDASNMKDVLSHLQLTMEESSTKMDLVPGELDAGAAEGDGDENMGGDAPYGPGGVGDVVNESINDEDDESFCDARRTRRERSADSSPANSAATTGADNRALYALLQDLDQERSVLMKEIESEEQHRVWFYRQLEVITNKLKTLPLSDTYNLQTDMARRQLEYEAQQVHGAMTEKLGSAEQSLQRQEARMRRIRTIDSEMLSLQKQQQIFQRVSAVGKREMGVNTMLSKNVFSLTAGQEAGGYTSDRSVAKAADGRYITTVAAQTADVTLTQDESHKNATSGAPLAADPTAAMYHGAWPIHKDMGLGGSVGAPADLGSVMSFTSTNTHSSRSSQASIPMSCSSKAQPPQQLGTKVEMVYSLLSMLGTHDKDDMSRTLLAMSSSQDSCIAMRQSGCLPLLIQLLHGSDKDSGLLGNTRGSAAARARASASLHNIVHSNPDEKRGRREARTLRLLEQIRAHCDQQRGETTEEEDEEGVSAASKASDIDHHPGPAIAALMKLSFDEDYRHAICTLGGLQAMAELLEVDHSSHGNTAENYSVTVRRYACMALTNLTFGDGKNKALLCSMRPAMMALVAQLRSPNEDLCQGAASVLRNLSWRADLASKKTLREVGAVTTLMESSMVVKRETTLKSMLSALWNLSSHCSENKADICVVKGALEFLVSLLTYKSAGKTHAIVENGGGILRNISSQIAVREDYRRVLRQKGCLHILLSQLRSTSLTIVSNACGTLWNLSARCVDDQDLLREMGAVSMLRNLVHSKHKMIAMGSSAALRNLLSSTGGGKGMDCDRGGSSSRPTLSARRQRALEEELEAQNLSETCENVDSPRDSPTDSGGRFVYPGDKPPGDGDPRRAMHRRQVATRCGSSDSADSRTRSPQRVPRAGSQDSVSSTHSDISHDRSRVHHMLTKSSHLLTRRQGGSLERHKDGSSLHRVGSDHACSSSVDRRGRELSPRRGRESSPSAGQPQQSSRIVRYMQEVAMLAGVGDSVPSSNPDPYPQPQIAHSSSFTTFPQNRSITVHPQPQKLYEHLVKKNSSINLGYEREEDSDSSEQPVNYSLKYHDSPTTMYPEPSVLGMSVQPTSLHSSLGHAGQPRPGVPHSAHSNPVRKANPQVAQYHASRQPGNVKVDNYAGSTASAHHMGAPGSVVHNRFPVPDSFSPHHRLTPPPRPPHHQQLPPPQQFIQQPKAMPLSAGQQLGSQKLQGYAGHKVQGYAGQKVQGCAGQKVQGSQPRGNSFVAYAETDLDSMDEQPTDFSLRYAEDHSDDQEQPVNYSVRYPNDPDPGCSECKYEEARRTNERLELSSNDDQVLTFCTEGTPFLSTATSLTDLTGGKQGEDEEEEETQRGKLPKGKPAFHNHHHHHHHHNHNQHVAAKLQSEDDSDELHNYSAQYGESEDNPANSSSCGHTGSTVRPASSHGNRCYSSVSPASQIEPPRSFHNADIDSIPPDQVKAYCEEGTPVCFSRVSSLSSLHSSEARDMNSDRPVMLQSIDESEKSEMSTSVIENKNAIGMKTALADRDQRRSQRGGEAEKEGKTVTFDEKQQVEETPLMFSRCSSLGSLSSFDTQSVHSSVVSEYSRRASQVVSPSELPDSPSETMPPSPRRLQSPPVKSFKPMAAAGSGGLPPTLPPPPVSSAQNGSSSNPLPLSTVARTGKVGMKVDWQRGAENIPVDDRTAKLLDIYRSSLPTAANMDDAVSLSGQSEVPVVYADEGTPPVFSETSSLSALTLDGEAGKGHAVGAAPCGSMSWIRALTPLQPGQPGLPSQQPPSASASWQQPQLSSEAECNMSVTQEEAASESADVTLCERDKTLVFDEDDSFISDVSEGDEDILAQCISAAMPAPSSSRSKLRKSSSDIGLKKKSAGIATDPVSLPSNISKSRLPTKTHPQSSTPQAKRQPPQQQAPMTVKPLPRSFGGSRQELLTRGDSGGRKTAAALPAAQGGGKQAGHAAKPPRPAAPTQSKLPPTHQPSQRPSQPLRQAQHPDDDYAADTVQTFATEGTPLNFSAATSLSDLSQAAELPEGKGRPENPKSPEYDCRSDDSSVCEESEQQLLNDMIQSAMPKARTTRRLDMERLSAPRGQSERMSTTPRASPVPRSQPERAGTPRVQTEKGPARSAAAASGVRARLSGAAVPGARVPTPGREESRRVMPTSQAKPLPQVRQLVDLEVPDVSSAADTTKIYDTEGTPNNFSAATSLSDLTIDSVDDPRGGRLSGTGRSPAKSSASVNYGGSQGGECSLFTTEGVDSPRVYGMEGTPTTFSRNDSLSSIEILDDKNDGNYNSDGGGHVPSVYPSATERHVIGQSSEDSSVKSENHRSKTSANKDERKEFCVEDTPVSFSRNSSLSSLASGGRAREPQPEDEPQISRTSSMNSLSADSAGFVPTASEQALLDQCINAAMPKRRQDDRSRRHTRGPKNEGQALQEGGSLKTSTLQMHAELDSRYVGDHLPSPQDEGHSHQSQKLMTRSCSDAVDFEPEEGSRASRFSSWRKQRQVSSDTMKVQPVTIEKDVRSRSQDNKRLKQHKDLCNHITKSTGGDSSASSSNSTSWYAQPGSASAIRLDHVILVTDNRLFDRREQRVTAQAQPDHPLLTSFTDSSSSGEKADSEKSVNEENIMRLKDLRAEEYNSAEERDEDEMELNQTVLEVSAQDENSVLETTTVENTTVVERLEDEVSFYDYAPDSVPYEEGLEERLCFGSGDASFEEGGGGSEQASFDQEITPEDELLLQHNASLIVSELVTKRDMTGSNFDEDMFIENETLSLVSNDYTSDTASEVSVSWSINSETKSDRSCSQASQAETIGSGSAKVVKPGSKLAGRRSSQDEVDPKLVRGRRKPLYNKPSTAGGKTGSRIDSSSKPSSRPASGGSGNSRPNSGTGGGSARPLSGGNAKSPAGRGGSATLGAGGTPPKKNLPKGQPGSKSNIPAPKSSPTTPKSSPTTPQNPKPNAKTSVAANRPGIAKPQTSTGSGIPRSPAKPGSTSNTPPSRLPSATKGKDSPPDAKPKYPLKQATFVKDTKASSSTPSDVRLRTRSASRNRNQSDKRNPGGSVQRNSTGSPPEAWSKALNNFRFIVDDGSENGCVGKQIQTHRGAKKSPPGTANANSSVAGSSPSGKGQQQQRPSNIARPQAVAKVGGNSQLGSKSAAGPSTPRVSNLPSKTTNLNKSGSASSLRKTSSGTSLAKTSSGSSLNGGAVNKPASAGLKKPGVTAAAKAEVKKSESSASLRRGSDGSRPTTPNGRRPSNPMREKSADEGKRGSGGFGNAGKRQVPSKIASLWKKEDVTVGRSLSMEEAALVAASGASASLSGSSLKLKTKSSSLPATARNMSFKSGTFINNSSSTCSSQSSGDDSCSEVIRRSSTYDKIQGSDRGHKSSEELAEAVIGSGDGVVEICGEEDDLRYLETGTQSTVNLDDAYIQEDHVHAEAVNNGSSATMHRSADSLEEASADSKDCVFLPPPALIIDSSTWRRKPRPSKDGDVTFSLPNADETCRSMCSFLTANDSQNESLAPDMGVWQKCGEDSLISELSLAAGNDASLAGTNRKGKSKKSVAKSIKSTLAGLKLFGSKQSKDGNKAEKEAKQLAKERAKNDKDLAKLAKELAKAEKDNAKFKDKMDRSVSKKSPTEESKPMTASCGTSTASCGTSPFNPPAVKTISIPISKSTPGAIVAPVAPFNYSPPSACNSATSGGVTKDTVVAETTQERKKVSAVPAAVVLVGAPTVTTAASRHMTKTEMLLARRRQSHLSKEDGEEGEASGQRGCMVTTV